MPDGTLRAALIRATTAAFLLVPWPVLHANDRASRVRAVPVPAGGRAVLAKCDSRGTIHLVYQTADGPRYVPSVDNGISFGGAIPIVNSDSRLPDPQLTFDVWDLVVGANGRIHVALGSNAWKLKLPKEDWGLYYTSLEHGAREFSPLRNLNGHPSEGFSLAADEQGDVTACWLSGKLYANVSHDNGKTFGPNVEINPAYDPCDCCTTRAVYAADGKLAVLYREQTNDERDMYLVLWDQQRGRTSRTRVSTTPWRINACPMSYYSISCAADGFVAVWPTGSRYDIYFARLDLQGKVLPPGEIQTPGMAGHRTGMIALSGPDGSTLVAWKKDNQLAWQLYDATGRPTGIRESAPSDGEGVAGVVGQGGQFILFR